MVRRFISLCAMSCADSLYLESCSLLAESTTLKMNLSASSEFAHLSTSTTEHSRDVSFLKKLTFSDAFFSLMWGPYLFMMSFA